MCAYNDKLRSNCDTRIAALEEEYENESKKVLNIIIAKGEIQLAIKLAQCAIDNVSECDFGGDKILSSIMTSQQGYKEKEDYYDEYLVKCKNAMAQISSEKDQEKKLKRSLPKDCGFCSECNPSVT